LPTLACQSIVAVALAASSGSGPGLLAAERPVSQSKLGAGTDHDGIQPGIELHPEMSAANARPATRRRERCAVI